MSVFLPEQLKCRLDDESKSTGMSKSELVRRLLDKHLPKPEFSPEEFRARLDAAFGAWEDRDFDGEAYVERTRTGRRLRERYG